MCKEMKIYEKLALDEVYILYRDDEGIAWVGNKDGHAFMAKTYFKEKGEIT